MNGEEEFRRIQERQRGMRGPDGPKGTICTCAVCGERFGSTNGQCPLTCKDHRTAEQRRRYYADAGK